ncbi:MAG: hypothetical protein A2086_06470 [Spirochaetes bacterium GWD1_27_9]|nr:MAG: hypothetical protein A2Z98_12045 [Spirochaetes bacterium GWB1_27_13]OHD40649.1 MAG: hypothetical protein A2086_06470 [Spirochaetes bacterium GWD1_27_9]
MWIVNNIKKYFFLILLLSFSFNIQAKTLKVLLWNTENFFDTKDEPKKDDTVLTDEQFNQKLNNISSKIKEINPDIVGLCEIENIFVLEQLAKKSNYKYFYLEEGNDPRGIDVGVLSKYKLEYKTNKNLPTPYKENKNYKFSRDCTESYFEFNKKKFYILLTHLKSSFRDDKKSEKKREAQIFGILDIISNIYEQNKEEPYLILMGDLNSNRFSEPLNILQKSGLVILNYFYKKKNVYTIIYKKKKEDIDYIIFNKKLFDEGKIKKFKSFNSNDFKKISDHFPLYVEIDL